MANYHLVILKKPYLEAIVAGRKRIESRFTMTRRAYLGRVLPGDRLFLKESSGPVCAVATVAAVRNFESLTRQKIADLKHQYNHHIKGAKEYWQSKANCRFGFLVWLKEVEPIEPVRIHKRDWRAWVILTEKEDFGLAEMYGRRKSNKG
ncbi:MAG: ASCH domain-containing protein [Planctomycetota bacterium]|jgi:ASC-1-like (ASCH) protein